MWVCSFFSLRNAPLTYTPFCLVFQLSNPSTLLCRVHAVCAQHFDSSCALSQTTWFRECYLHFTLSPQRPHWLRQFRKRYIHRHYFLPRHTASDSNQCCAITPLLSSFRPLRLPKALRLCNMSRKLLRPSSALRSAMRKHCHSLIRQPQFPRACGHYWTLYDG